LITPTARTGWTGPGGPAGPGSTWLSTAATTIWKESLKNSSELINIGTMKYRMYMLPYPANIIIKDGLIMNMAIRGARATDTVIILQCFAPGIVAKGQSCPDAASSFVDPQISGKKNSSEFA
jgi:hypothetical protein